MNIFLMIYRFPKKTFRVQNSLKMNWKNVIKKPTLKIIFVSRSEDNWEEGSLGTKVSEELHWVRDKYLIQNLQNILDSMKS